MKELVLTKLAELGDSAEQIAASLKSLGIRGQLQNAYHCPISVFLEREFSKDGEPPADPSVCDLDIALWMNGEFQVIITPLGIADFIHCFDHEAFPELVEES